MKWITILFFLIISECNAQSPQQMFWIINKPKSVGDIDSILFVNKVVSNGGALSSTEKTAVGQLIRQLKDSSLWSLMKCIYPFVGGTIYSCKVNLVNPSLYSLSFAPGNPIFSSTGVKGDLTNHGITGLVPFSVLSVNSTSMSFYSRDSATSGGLDIGANDAVNRTYFSPGGGEVNTAASSDLTSTSLRTGLFTISRIASTGQSAYRNGVNIMSSSSVSSVLPNLGIFIFARNNQGTASSLTNRELAFVSIGLGLTAAQAVTLYNIVQAFETTLGRQV